MITTVQENLAKLMSNEDITVIQQPVKTAYFNTEKRVLVIPTWEKLSDIIVELLIGHEIGHALYTNSTEWIDALKLREPNDVFRDYLNIIEDARIESLVKQRYPGMKKIFFHGYYQILETKIMEIDHDTTNLPLIDRLNIYFKFNSHITLSLSAREEYYIRKIESVVNFQDVIDIAIELFDSELHKPNSSPSSLETELIELLESNISEESSDKSVESDDTETDVSRKTHVIITDDTQTESPKKTDSAVDPTTPPTSQTLRDLDNSLSDLVDISAEQIMYVDIPSPILKNIIYPFESIKIDFDKSQHSINRTLQSKYNKLPPEDSEWGTLEDSELEDSELEDSELEEIFGKKGTSLSTFYNEHKNNISLHKQLFQMRKKADVHNKTMTFRTGSLDMNKLYSYKYNDQIFKTVEVRPNGTNHGLIFIMDFSSSMRSYLNAAKTKALELILFCKQIGIPYVLYGFFDSMRLSSYDGYSNIIFDTNVGKTDYILETDPNFRLLELLSSRMSDSNFKCMVDIFINHIGNTMYSLGGTPLSETHLCLDSLVSKFRQDCHAKIVNVVYFTDGVSKSKDFVSKQTHRKTYGSKFVIHDPKTKQNHHISEGYSICGYALSSESILKIIKTRMKDVTVINFLITCDLIRAITEDQQIQCFTEMGFSPESIKREMRILNRPKNYNVQLDAHRAAASKYIVIEQVNRGSFDTTFICSTEMFKKQKLITHNAKETTLSVSETFCKTASRTKRVNIMISKFIDLIV